MTTLADLIKMLLLILLIIFCLVSAPFVLLRVVEVCNSPGGPWADYPHSGFCPDAPASPNSRFFKHQ